MTVVLCMYELSRQMFSVYIYALSVAKEDCLRGKD